MSGYYHAHVRELVFKRQILPKAQRHEVEDSIRYLYRRMSDRDFSAFLFLVGCAGNIGRAIGWALRVIGLDKVRQQIFERLKGA